MRSANPSVLAFVAVALVSATLLGGRASGDKDGTAGGLEASALDKIVGDTLKDVINRGADLYNAGEAVACYRLYEGALRTIKPFLKHRPGVQQAIDEGLLNAERDNAVWRRAFVLRAVLDKVRKEVRGKVEEKKEEKKLIEKKPIEKPEDEKKKEVKEPREEKKVKAGTDAGTIAGKVTLKGVPLTSGLVRFHSAKGKTVTALIAANGTYSARRVPVGEAKVSVVTVEPLASAGDPKVLPKLPPKGPAFTVVPEKYHEPDTSGLAVTVTKGAQNFDLVLDD